MHITRRTVTLDNLQEDPLVARQVPRFVSVVAHGSLTGKTRAAELLKV